MFESKGYEKKTSTSVYWWFKWRHNSFSLASSLCKVSMTLHRVSWCSHKYSFEWKVVLLRQLSVQHMLWLYTWMKTINIHRGMYISWIIPFQFMHIWTIQRATDLKTFSERSLWDPLLLKHDTIWLLSLPRPYYGHMTVSPDLYSANSHMMMSPDVYAPNGYLPRSSNDQHPGNSYLPSVSYSLDHLDRLDYQVIYWARFYSERMFVCVF